MTVPPNVPVEEGARLMVREKISALPVTLGGRLLGIVTGTDVLELFVRALDAGEPSSRLDVILGPNRSALADVVQIVEAAGTPVSSIMTLSGPDWSRGNHDPSADDQRGPYRPRSRAKGIFGHDSVAPMTGGSNPSARARIIESLPEAGLRPRWAERAGAVRPAST